MILIDDFEIDAALSEDHTFDSDVTEHPVEEGADITDHVRARPIEVSIQGIVSDTPIGRTAFNRGFDPSGELQMPVLPSDVAFSNLLAIRDAREPITITTSLKTFERMILTSLTVPATGGDALEFTARFRQIELVTNRRTTIPVATPRAAHGKDLGNKPSVTPTTPEAKASASAEKFGPSKLAPEMSADERALRSRRVREVHIAGRTFFDDVPPDPPQSKIAPPAVRTAAIGRQLLGAR